MLLRALCSISYALVNSNWSYSRETTNLGQIRQFLEPCDLEIWRMTLKNIRAPLLCYFKFCAAFRTHWWIQTGCHPWRQNSRHALVIRYVSYANPEVCWLKNNTLTPRQNDRHFSNDSLNCKFLYKHFRSLIQIAQKYVPEVSISNKL